jgi:hypothetical protein
MKALRPVASRFGQRSSTARPKPAKHELRRSRFVPELPAGWDGGNSSPDQWFYVLDLDAQGRDGVCRRDGHAVSLTRLRCHF